MHRVSEETKQQIVRLALEGVTQNRISVILKVSRYAVSRYSKGINAQKITPQEVKDEVRRLALQTSMTQKDIADAVGISASVARPIILAAREEQLKLAEMFPKNPPPHYDNVEYELHIYNVAPDFTKEVKHTYDRLPMYWDMRFLCESIGIPAEDFMHEEWYRRTDKCEYGKVLGHREKVLAMYCIERIQGSPDDYQRFIDGYDKKYYLL